MFALIAIFSPFFLVDRKKKSSEDPVAESYKENGIDLDAWYRKYGESVYRRLLRLTRNRDHALDLTQEVFLRVHRYQKSYRGEAKPLTWLFTIADRSFFSFVKSRKPEFLDTENLERFLDDESKNVDTVFEDHALVARLIERAPKDTQAILVHRYFDEMELEQIASILNINERTVRRKLETFFNNARKYLSRDET